MLSLLAGVAAAGLLAEVRTASAALPGPRFESGAFCTRSRCATDAGPSWSGPLGFAASALACIGLGRRSRPQELEIVIHRKELEEPGMRPPLPSS